jgi:hypothetical protein
MVLTGVLLIFGSMMLLCALHAITVNDEVESKRMNCLKTIGAALILAAILFTDYQYDQELNAKPDEIFSDTAK